MTNLDAIFAKNLVSYRKAKGFLSAESFAEALEISLRTLQRYEAGERLPSSDKIELMAEKLGVQPQDFFKTEDAIVIEKSEPVSAFAKKLINIPDEIYDLAQPFGPDHAVWRGVKAVLKDRLKDLEKEKAKTKEA